MHPNSTFQDLKDTVPELRHSNLDLSQFNNRVYDAKFVSKRNVGGDAYEFTFVVEGRFTFKPGQYIWLNLPHIQNPDERGQRRALSIVNLNTADNFVSVLFRSSSTSFKQAAMKLTTNDTVEIIGPHGSSFCLPEDSSQPLVLMAGGTGIAPFMSLMRHEHKNKSNRPIYLIYSDERGDQAAYYDELQDLHGQNIQYIFNENKFTEEQLRDAKNLSSANFYISGTQGYVDYYYDILRKHGVERNRMQFENFYPSSDVVALMQELFIDNDPAAHELHEAINLGNAGRDILLTAIKSSTHHIIITDINGVIVFANKAAEELTGFTFAEMRHQTPRLWGGLMPASFYHNLWESKLHGHTINEEIVNRHKDGSLYVVMSHIAPIINRNGETLGFIGTEEDITTIRQQENHASSTASLLEATLLGIAEGLIITDANGIIVSSNQSAEEMLGYSSKELTGKLLVDALIMVDREGKVIPTQERVVTQVITNKNRIISDGINSELSYRRKDGSLINVNIAASPIIVNNILVGTVEIIRDISKEKEVDFAKSEFVALASHQLRTPLSAINWNAELLMGGDAGQLSTEQNNFVKEIYASSQRMVELVRALLNVSRIELGTLGFDPSPQDVKAIIQSCLEDQKPLKEKNIIELKLRIADMPKINVDSRLITLVVQNLSSNAIKYSHPGGVVEIIAELINSKHEYAQFELNEDVCEAPSLYLRFTDNGIGIPQDQKRKIFSKMFRADNAQTHVTDGNGLGLYTVKGVVESVNGKVWFESNSNKGTIFHVIMPLSGLAKKDAGIKLLDV